MAVKLINKIRAKDPDILDIIASIKNELPYAGDHDCTGEGSTLTLTLVNGHVNKDIQACCKRYHGLIKHTISDAGISDRISKTKLE